MKKKLIALGAFVLLLAGCSDATTQVKDDDKVFITIGDEEITKGDVYSGLKAQGDVTPISEKMNEILVDKLVPVTKEIEKEAKDKLAEYKTSYAEKWEENLKTAGYETEDDFYKKVILLNVRVEKLSSSFVKKDFKNLSEKYKPREVEIVEIKDQAKVEKALEEAKKGTPLDKVAETYGDKSTYDGSAKVYNSKSGLSDTLWSNITKAKKAGDVSKNIIQDTTTQSYFIVKVTKVNPTKFKEEAIKSIASIQLGSDASTDTTADAELSIADQAVAYFLQQNGYSIHDVDIYQSLLTSSSKYER